MVLLEPANPRAADPCASKLSLCQPQHSVTRQPALDEVLQNPEHSGICDDNALIDAYTLATLGVDEGNDCLRVWGIDAIVQVDLVDKQREELTSACQNAKSPGRSTEQVWNSPFSASLPRMHKA